MLTARVTRERPPVVHLNCLKRFFYSVRTVPPHSGGAREGTYFQQPAESTPLADCGDTRLEICTGYWVQDCSNCAMSMLLAAHALGIGAVWTGIYPLPDRVEGFRALCGLPGEVFPLALLVMGHPAAFPFPEDRF